MEAQCQQFQLYAAEGNGGGDLVAPSALQEYVDELRELPYWERNFPQVLRIEAHCDSRRKTSSVGAWFPHKNAGLICMMPEHMSEQFILHEVAHVLAKARYNSNAHDPWFARTYLELVCAVLPTEVYTALQKSFDEHGIDYDTHSSVPGGIEL